MIQQNAGSSASVHKHKKVHNSFIHNIPKLETIKCSSSVKWINCGTFAQWLSTSIKRDKLQTQQQAFSWTKETRCATIMLYDSICIKFKKQAKPN